jgi:hypothetical protein
MNAYDLARQETEDDDPSLKSGVRAAEPPPPADPDWSSEPPRAALPHEPESFDAPPPLPDHREVLAAVWEEALGSGLCRRMF